MKHPASLRVPNGPATGSNFKSLAGDWIWRKAAKNASDTGGEPARTSSLDEVEGIPGRWQKKGFGGARGGPEHSCVRTRG